MTGARITRTYGHAMNDRYGIRADYISRSEPEYFDDTAREYDGLVWQPDVYRHAAAFADRLGAGSIIDIGPGSGDKLNAIAGRRHAIGLDFGANLQTCASRYPHREWRELDIDNDAALPVTVDELTGAVIVCADVIEHLVRPERLMALLADALAHASVAVLSTPDRVRLAGPRHLGPPRNPHHVREWTRDELAAFLRIAGFEHAVVRYTRENNMRPDFRTIEAVIGRDAMVLERIGLPCSGVMTADGADAPVIDRFVGLGRGVRYAVRVLPRRLRGR